MPYARITAYALVDEMKWNVMHNSVADVENFVGGGEHLLAACGRWSLSNRR